MLFYKIIRLITYPILALIFPTKIIGKKNFFDEKAVVCCNHYSSIDSILIASKLLKGGCYCVGKEEAFKSKFGNWFFLKMGAIPIKRGENDLTAYRRILSVLKSGKQLLIFPEGTRNTTGKNELTPFFTGAALFSVKSDSPVIPLILYRKPKPFKRNYLLVGEPISLAEYATLSPHEMKEKATATLFEKMKNMQNELNNIVAERT